MSVVGAMLLDQAAIGRAQEYLEQDDFYSRQYGIMFQTMLELDRVGMAVDPVTLQEKLKEQNLPPEIYSAEALSALLAQVPTSANIVSYAKIVAAVFTASGPEDTEPNTTELPILSRKRALPATVRKGKPSLKNRSLPDS